jgi:tRNA dimethylallyltransferase
MTTPRPILAIVGVTGSGKNELAQEVARRTGSTLVSVDSRKVYRGLDIGTAKPKPEIIHEFDYGMIDCADPIEHFSAARYACEARAIVADRLTAGRPVILVGGTGFYLDAFINGLADLPEIGESTRERLLTEAEARGWQALYDEAKSVDPEFIGRIHPGDKTRIRRVLEAWWQTGQRLSALLSQRESSPCPWTVRVVWPDVDRGLAKDRIRQRVGKMREAGLTAEVRNLLEAGVPADAPGLATVGYQEIAEFLRGQCDEKGAYEKVIHNTCRYAKRQATWFRHRDYVQRLSDYPVEPERIINIWRNR